MDKELKDFLFMKNRDKFAEQGNIFTPVQFSDH